MATLRNISARRVKDERLQQLQKLEAVGRLAAGIAHDFRNLIAVVQSGLRLIGKKSREGAPQAEIDTLIEEVTKRTQNAEALAGQLVSFSHTQAMMPQTVDINRQITSVVSMLARTLGSGVSVAAKLADNVGAIEVDPDQLDVAFLNLALNGRDAMGERGQLTIESSLDVEHDLDDGDGEFVRVTVRDSGSGMTAEVKDKIFEPFFTTKGDGNGTGLGLIQVYGFVMRSGGHIQIESEPGTGTAVHLFLPRHAGTGTSEGVAAVP